MTGLPLSLTDVHMSRCLCVRAQSGHIQSSFPYSSALGICCPAAFSCFQIKCFPHGYIPPDQTCNPSPFSPFFPVSIAGDELYSAFLQRNLRCWRARGKPPTTVPTWTELSWVTISKHRNPLSRPSGSCSCLSTQVGSTLFMLIGTSPTKIHDESLWTFFKCIL